jgi:glycosyltransferase involved in cell wall biosynthesis
MFDFVVLSRPESAENYLELIRSQCPSAKVIYNTVDLHFLRLGRMAEMTKDKELAVKAERMKSKELDFIDKSDATIILSTAERDLLSENEERSKKLWTIPLIRKKSERLVTYDSTADFAFIGGYNHPPNLDAAEWLITEIWPEIRKTVPEARLFVCGSNMPERFYEYDTEDIIIRGFVPDLNSLLAGLRMTLAPLRFGAGLKGKVASSIGAGVPCLGTPTAFEGMNAEGLDIIRLVATTPKEFAALASMIYSDEGLWTEISKAGVDYHNANYAYQTVMKAYRNMLLSIAD